MSIWGAGVVVFNAVYYAVWLSLKDAAETLPNGDHQFVREYGHGYFIFGFLFGLAVTYGGIKLYMRKAKEPA